MSAEEGPSSTASVIRQVVPKAQFFEDVPAFVKESGKQMDDLLGEVQSTLQRCVEPERGRGRPRPRRKPRRSSHISE